MKRLIEFPLESGETILIEVDIEEARQAGWLPASSPARMSDDVPVKAALTFESAMEKVKPAASSIIKKLRGLSDPPDEMTVEFGLKLSAESGVVVAAASIEANYSVALKWKRESKNDENKKG